jgi:hypothetical protein
MNSLLRPVEPARRCRSVARKRLRAKKAAPKTLVGVKKAGVLQVAARRPMCRSHWDSTAAITWLDVEIVTVNCSRWCENRSSTQWSGVIPALYAGRFHMCRP